MWWKLLFFRPNRTRFPSQWNGAHAPFRSVQFRFCTPPVHEISKSFEWHRFFRSYAFYCTFEWMMRFFIIVFPSAQRQRFVCLYSFPSSKSPDTQDCFQKELQVSKYKNVFSHVWMPVLHQLMQMNTHSSCTTQITFSWRKKKLRTFDLRLDYKMQWENNGK